MSLLSALNRRSRKRRCGAWRHAHCSPAAIPSTVRLTVTLSLCVSPCLSHCASLTVLFRLFPDKLRRSLMPFQRASVRWALRQGGRVLIGDDMGLVSQASYKSLTPSQHVWHEVTCTLFDIPAMFTHIILHTIHYVASFASLPTPFVIFETYLTHTRYNTHNLSHTINSHR